MSLLWFLIIGAAAGWLAGQMMKGGGFGLAGNLVVGCLGAVLGGWLFGSYFGGGLIASLVVALLGALVLLFIIGLIKK